MPEIARFLGITIYMIYGDHGPAHFHAQYGDYQISVEISSGAVAGKFPKRALNAVLEWYRLHKEELTENWNRMERHEVLMKIEPLGRRKS